MTARRPAHVFPLTFLKGSCCSRRDFLRSAAGAMVAGALYPVPATAQGIAAAQSAATQSAAAQSGTAATRVAAGDLLVRADRPGAQPLRPEDVETGVPLMAWPFDPVAKAVRSGVSLNRIVLIKVDPSKLSERTRRRATGGILAYSAVCTHSGCDVSDWDAQEQALVCPCHASMFDPLDGGEVIDGPAPRALPALPLSTSDGQLVVAGPFSSAPGFDPA
jgi:rieske iron-sulfur protein